MTIRYTVSAQRPNEHRIEVVGDLETLGQATVDLVLPSWVPGSYWIAEYSRYLDDLSARDGDRTLRVERIDKARWRLHADGAGRVQVAYSVYGYQMMNEAVDVTTEHLFLNACFAFPFVDGRTREAYEVVLPLPSDWKAYHELEEVGHAPLILRAKDYDELLDNPIDCGRPVELGFHAAGVPHRLVLCGEAGNFELHRLHEDLPKMAEAAIRLFGESPVPHYTFFVHVNDTRDGALEHARSNSAVLPRTIFRPPSEYREFLSIQSHEYFHLYNVKRIRPAKFDPFDYTREVYTTLLWAMEGTTDYYAYVVLRRAGLFTPAQFLQKLAGEAHRYLNGPGRRHRSLTDASWLSWIDLYKPTEEFRNRSVSYYLKGLLVSQCLDLEIRERTENRASLDTAMMALWSQYGRTGKGVGEDELLPAFSQATGVDLAPFFAKYIAGTDEIDFDRFAKAAGLRFGPKPKTAEPDADPDPGWLGIEYENRNGLARITMVLDGSPGRRAGLSPGDELVAVDRVKLVHADVPKALGRAPAGTDLDLALFRRGVLRHVTVTTGAAPPEQHEYRPVEQPTPLQQAIYEEWTASKWEPPRPKT